jgi:DNA-binding transcriptional LysR family regulator
MSEDDPLRDGGDPDHARAAVRSVRRGFVNRLDLFTLKLFVTVIEERSIARAAERENIATSAASRRISDLEHAIGTPLITRHHKGIDSTAAGRAVLRHARVVLGNLALLEDDLADYSAGISGQVRVVANDSTIFGYLPEELAEFLKLHPKVQVDFEAKVSPDILRAVAERAADIGLFAGDLVAEGLSIHPYHRDRLVVLVPERHHLATRASVGFVELLKEELIDQERGSSIEALILRAAAILGQSPRGRIRVSSFHQMGRMVEAGLGIGIVPELFALRIKETSGIAVLGLDEAWAERQHKICTCDAEPLSQAARLLVQHLVKSAAA